MKNSTFHRSLLAAFCLIFLGGASSAAVAGPATPPDSFWFPRQKAPQEVVTCSFQTKNIPEHMLAESLSGLAAQSVNDGTGTEMIWLKGGPPDYLTWYSMICKRFGLQDDGEAYVWDLVKKFADAGVVKGYVLFDEDTSEGALYELRQNMNTSSNTATVLASILKGVMVERKLETRAQQLGLKKLADAATMTNEECFEKYKDQLNNNMVLAVDPKVGENRDIAIAQRAMTIYGLGPFEEKVMEWVAPLAPVLGWNGGGESEHTGLATRWAHFNTASNWAMNLPLLSAESWDMKIDKASSVDPRKIDYGDKRSCHSFIMTDGDNLQWMCRNFIFNPNFWANPYATSIPMSWTANPCNLSMANPYAWNTLVKGQKTMALSEYGGGYEYPDIFAKDRPDREQLLREFARRINEHLKQTGVKVFGFITAENRWSDDAKFAYKIFAEEMDGIIGMFAVQYNPYQDSKGDIFWVRNRQGVEIPVIAPKFNVWASGKTKGTMANPQIIAGLINRDAAEGQNFNFSIVHAWSWYSQDADGNVADAGFHGDKSKGDQTGVTPVEWCKKKLNKNVMVVPLDELIWRIRMQHDPVATKKLLNLK